MLVEPLILSSNQFAAKGSNAATAAKLDKDYCVIASGTGGVMLPVEQRGNKVTVVNSTGSTINVYPPDGGTVDGGASIAVPAGKATVFHIVEQGGMFALYKTEAAGSVLSISSLLANPTASIGLTAINGSAITAMRSDAAPALNLTISPTWTGQHTFSNASSPIVRINAPTSGPWALDLFRADYGVGSKVFAHKMDSTNIGWCYEHQPYVAGIREYGGTTNRIVFPTNGYGGYSWDFLSSSTTQAIRLGGADGTIRSWWYASGSTYGFLNGGGSWNLAIDGSTIKGHLPFASAALAGGGGTRYGSISVSGTAGSGWNGINFGDTQTDLLWASTQQGGHKAGVGWMWRFDDGVLAVGTVPAASIGGGTAAINISGTAADSSLLNGYPSSNTNGAANTVPIRNASGYTNLYYINSSTVNSENPGISQVITTNGSDDYYRKSSITHLGNSLNGSNPAARARGLKRRDDPSDYNVQPIWTGAHWLLQGYYGDSSYHAECRVGYADSAGNASTATSATSATSATTSSYSTYLWSTSHPGSYYISNAWTGSYWQLTSNHGSPVQVGYADTSGNGVSSFSNSGTGYIIFNNGFKIMWGTVTTVGNNSYTVNFPTSFSSYSRVMCTGTVASGNRQDNGPGTASSSTSSFVLYDCDDTSKTSQWVAFGY